MTVALERHEELTPGSVELRQRGDLIKLPPRVKKLETALKKSEA